MSGGGGHHTSPGHLNRRPYIIIVEGCNNNRHWSLPPRTARPFHPYNWSLKIILLYSQYRQSINGQLQLFGSRPTRAPETVYACSPPWTAAQFVP